MKDIKIAASFRLYKQTIKKLKKFSKELRLESGMRFSQSDIIDLLVNRAKKSKDLLRGIRAL